MNPERAELARLVDELPDEEVPAVLADVRRRLQPVPDLPEGTWPPPWFGMIKSGRPDVATHVDEYLAEGFGRSQVILVDTGPLVAAADADEEHHRACVNLFADLRAARQSLLISPLVVAEVAYMLSRFGGSVAEAEFLRSIRAGEFELLALTSADLDRMIELVETYADMGLGSTDASVIALAERLGVSDVATLDRRHFGAVRPSHVAALTLLP